MDVLFERAIGAFCLSVCLWVIGCGEAECCLELFEEFAPEGGYEAWVAIADDGARDSMNTDDVGDEKGCECGCVGCCICGDEVCHFGESVDDDEDCVERVGCGKAGDEIHGYVLPGGFWRLQGKDGPEGA